MTDALTKLREMVGKMDHYISALTGTHAKDICFRCQIEAILPELEQRERELREAAIGIMRYRGHSRGCEIDQTDFCTCGMKQAADRVRAALNPTE